MSSTFAVIFDMDGVIVHSNPAHKKAIQLFCERHDKDVTEDFLVNKLYGRTNKEWIPEIMGDISQERLKELADEKEQQFRDLFKPKENIVDGIHAFLEQLRDSGIPMAVATSAPVENADYILSTLGIENYFDVILDASHVNRGKPEPEVYLKAAQALDKEPEDCIVFEDSIAGVQAGLAAGAKVVGVTTTHEPHEFSDCDTTIADFRSITPDDLRNL